MGTVVVTTHGLLDPDSAQVLEEVLWDLIDNQGNLTVAIDLRDLSVSDPSCLEVLAAAAASAARRGGDLTLADPSDAVHRALTLTGHRQAGGSPGATTTSHKEQRHDPM